jgi:hypothetical protein
MRTTNVVVCQRCPWRVAAPTERRHGTCCCSGVVVGVVDSSFTTRHDTAFHRRGTPATCSQLPPALLLFLLRCGGEARSRGAGRQGRRRPRWWALESPTIPPSRPTTPIFLPSSSPHRRRCGLWFSSLAADTGARARRALYMWALGFESSHERQGCRDEDAWFPSAGASTTRATPWVRPRVRYGAVPSPDFPSQTSRGRKGHRVRLTSGSHASMKKERRKDSGPSWAGLSAGEKVGRPDLLGRLG